jgi:hypothetical protein
MPEDWHYGKALMATGFRAGRMIQEHGPQLVWVEMRFEGGKRLPFVCSVEHAREWAELLQEEAGRPLPQGRA